ncbi:MULTISPECIES: hypothetical protein, partial [Aphanothece]|uniref:hypothetical protein n=1 Tax=Aphanothece TaxID=1121 RepID=UPI003984ED90
ALEAELALDLDRQIDAIEERIWDYYCEADPEQILLSVAWTPETEPVLMRASRPARLGQEKPHETQASHPRADH